MIKIKVVVILMVAIMGITAVPIQASEKQGDSKKQENKATQVISDEEQELLKKEDIQVVSDENGNIKGDALKNQLDTLVKGDDTKFLFDSEKKTTKIKGAEPGKGDTDDGSEDKVDLSKMTYDERAAYLEEHPEIEV